MNKLNSIKKGKIKKENKLLILAIIFMFLFINVNCVVAEQEILIPKNLKITSDFEATAIPSDIYYENQWYLKKIKAPIAWDQIHDSEDVIIAIIDSGVQIEHPDLVDNIWVNFDEIPNNGIDDDKNGFIDDYNGWDFVNNVPDPRPKYKEGYSIEGIIHGTVVAGIAAGVGNNTIGVTGITWKAKIMPLKVLNDKGGGDVRNVIKAIDYSIANGADIINFSFVGGTFNQSLDSAIERAYKAGIVIVAAAGNEEGDGEGVSLDELPMYPVCHDGNNKENMVIGVAATDALDQKAHFSGYGFSCIDITAPGVSIFSTTVHDIANGKGLLSNYYDGYWSGTSMAVPMVSGAAALVKGVNPRFSRQEIVDILLDSTDNINRLNPSFLGRLGVGRLNIEKAVKTAKFIQEKLNMNLIVTPLSEKEPILSISDRDGNIIKTFLAYNENFRGGVNVAVGDLDGDGMNEIVSGAGYTGGPHVRIFDFNGNLKDHFFAYDKNFRGGVNVAVGDLDGDGLDEIVTGAGYSGESRVKIFDIKGNLKNDFFAYDKNFRGGVNVAVGDFDGDGINEIVTGAGYTGGPHVKVFDFNGNLESHFFAYDKNFRGGVNVAVLKGNTSRSGDKIVTAPSKNGGPHIRIFDMNGFVFNQFFAYDRNFHGGVSIATGDIDNDNYDEIITGAGSSGSPHVRVFKENGKLLNSFYAFDTGFEGGVNVAIIGY